MHKHFFNFLIVVFLMLGCSVKPIHPPQSKIDRLSLLLETLNHTKIEKENTKLSNYIFKQTQRLTKEFDLTSPPLWHNTLVNIGVRDKGLCYHWSDALYMNLNKQNYNYFSFYLVGANIGEYFGEHNALVIVKKGEETIENGIIIDPWRNSGKLYFSKMKEDKEYQWKRRKPRECFSGGKFIR